MMTQLVLRSNLGLAVPLRGRLQRRMIAALGTAMMSATMTAAAVMAVATAVATAVVTAATAKMRLMIPAAAVKRKRVSEIAGFYLFET